MRARLRFMFTAWTLHLRQMATIKIYLFDSVVFPLILSTIAVRLIGTGTDARSATATALGAAVMGMWAATLTGTGGAISRMRSMGLLEPVVAAPVPLATALAANALASATLGLYSVVVTLVWVRFGLGVPIDIAEPLLLSVAVLTTIAATAALGLTLSICLVLFPRGQSVSNVFEYPLWIVTGALIPLHALPVWLDRVSWAVGPAWGMKAIRAAVTGQTGGFAIAVAVCAVVSTAYWAISIRLLRTLEHLARERATLALT